MISGFWTKHRLWLPLFLRRMTVFHGELSDSVTAPKKIYKKDDTPIVT